MTNPPTSPSSGIAVEVRGLRKSFNGHEVLKGLDFEVNPGEVFVIMGPSGSGKTVLLKHIIGLEDPDAGEILIEGQRIQSEEEIGRASCRERGKVTWGGGVERERRAGEEGT